jgi:hypothetical protein
VAASYRNRPWEWHVNGTVILAGCRISDPRLAGSLHAIALCPVPRSKLHRAGA